MLLSRKKYEYTPVKVTCRNCGEEFTAQSPFFKYCSTACRTAYNNAKRVRTDYDKRKCAVCGKEIIIVQGQGRTMFCSDECRRVARNSRSATITQQCLESLDTKAYIDAKLVILHDMYIPRPGQDVINSLYDKSEVQIDNFFRGYMNEYFDKHYGR